MRPLQKKKKKKKRKLNGQIKIKIISKAFLMHKQIFLYSLTPRQVKKSLYMKQSGQVIPNGFFIDCLLFNIKLTSMI